MKIGFIGAGKVGFSLGKFFATSKIHVTGYYSRHIESSMEAAAFNGSKAFDNIYDVLSESDALFITVPDGMITSVYDELKKFELKGKYICHCSGAMSVQDAFPGIEDAGAYGYSIHPLFPVSDKLKSYRELPDAFFCLEGDAKHIGVWSELFDSLGVKNQIIGSDMKVRYHAACAISSNLVCALVKTSVDMLESCGFSKEGAIAALTPLVKSNIEHILADGPVKALTGPMERADKSTIEKHIKCFDNPVEKDLYVAVSKKLLEVAKEKNPDRNYEEINRVINI